MATTKVAIGIRVSPETKAFLDKEAAEDHRSVASLVEKIIAEWAKSKGKEKRK